MKKNRVTCESCSFRGYSSDFCKFHHKKITELANEDCHSHSRDLYKKIGKAATYGAGAGVLATTVGLAAVPAIGIKAAIGHSLAAKLAAGGGAAGAGVNVARRAKKSKSGASQKQKNGVLLPLYLKKRS